MDSSPFLRFIIAGQLRRDYILLPGGAGHLDAAGGSLLYAAAGLGLWENNAGLIARIGEDFPQEWVEAIAARGFDIRGIHILPQEIDLRWFAAYPDGETRQTGNIVSHFARLGVPFPKTLLGYTEPTQTQDSRNQPTVHTLRLNDFPEDYLDATAAHLCPLDYLSHSLLPPALRRGHVSTITLDPGAGYMDPIHWDEVPLILNGLTAFLCSEEKLTNLFQGRSTDLWEMAEALAGYGCDLIVIKRGRRGQYLYDHSRRARWTIPAYPAKVVDPTGAGDAFCGGFLVGFRNTYQPLDACLCGNVSASFVVEGSEPY
ncbi:MAG TPA: carbohydrate kinase family protein, partial [Anaerolineaceae bacterium]|nr:carbohydrate kinase family protein [Anaerolineaceae bacterium]